MERAVAPDGGAPAEREARARERDHPPRPAGQTWLGPQAHGWYRLPGIPPCSTARTLRQNRMDRAHRGIEAASDLIAHVSSPGQPDHHGDDQEPDSDPDHVPRAPR